MGSTPTGVTISPIKVSAVSENSIVMNQMPVSSNQAEALIQAISRLVELDISMRSVDTIKFVDPDQITLAIAFTAVKQSEKTGEVMDRVVRREAARVFRREAVIPSMIDRIKQILRMDEVAHGAGDNSDA